MVQCFIAINLYCLNLLEVGVYNLSHNKVRIEVYLHVRVGVCLQVFYFDSCIGSVPYLNGNQLRKSKHN